MEKTAEEIVDIIRQMPKLANKETYENAVKMVEDYANQKQPTPTDEEIRSELLQRINDELCRLGGDDDPSVLKSSIAFVAFRDNYSKGFIDAIEWIKNRNTYGCNNHTRFEDWYRKEYDPKGFLYPSRPIDISFKEMCNRFDRYLRDTYQPTEQQSKIENMKKIMRMADIPEIIIEHPDLFNNEVTEDDIKWAKGIISKRITPSK